MTPPVESGDIVYEAFGLRIRSALEFNAPIAPSDAGADVAVVYGTVAAQLATPVVEGARFQACHGHLLLSIDGVADFSVDHGTTITIERSPGATDGDVRVFLMGSVMASLLQQRGDVVLHGSVVAAGDGAVAFLGASGAGKSTIAMALAASGFPVLTDDLCALREVQGTWQVQPACRLTSLWPDALSALGFNPEALPLVRPNLSKRQVPVPMDTTPRPLKQIYVLEPWLEDHFEVRPLLGVDKVTSIRQHLYRRRIAAGLTDIPEQFRQQLSIAQQVSAALLNRPQDGINVEELTRVLRADLSL